MLLHNYRNKIFKNFIKIYKLEIENLKAKYKKLKPSENWSFSVSIMLIQRS